MDGGKRQQGDAPRVGLALGSGSARGWAHIGIIEALEEAGIRPEVVCGASIGALVGAAYASGNLPWLREWVETLSWWDVVRLMDVRLNGGFIEGERLMEIFREYVEDQEIGKLSCRFAAVATDLETGREQWLEEGSLLDAVRASMALPGLFSPARYQERWLVDGGLVNPVPVSLCRALGAEVVIAVNLNGDIVGKRRKRPPEKAAQEGRLDPLMNRLNESLRRNLPAALLSSGRGTDGSGSPGLFTVLLDSINIMQDRITRSRMAGDPPDVYLAPRLGHLGVLDYDRAAEAIEQGRRSMENALPELRGLLQP
ncbi:MAG: patatin-like phospholipase RssA [Gammaproteobacteria bacterium]|nr:patatin-like phospholipase RssA [Gammaproteobacteria bacterium]